MNIYKERILYKHKIRDAHVAALHYTYLETEVLGSEMPPDEIIDTKRYGRIFTRDLYERITKAMTERIIN